MKHKKRNAKRLALVGGRGYVGAAFLDTLVQHPALELVVAGSTSHAGLPISAVAGRWVGPVTEFVALTPADVTATQADVWVLALPNGASTAWVAAIAAHQPQAVIVDLGADYRFDDAWQYGLPELNRSALRGATRIANPGCYATGAQLALAPLVERLAMPPVVFGVSGYSGAGRSPGPRNDPQRLAENLLPYGLTGHLHEREISHRLGLDVRFHPHVAAFFRGISLTVSITLQSPLDKAELHTCLVDRYANEQRIGVQREIPEIRQVANTPDAIIGGIAVDPRDPHRATLVVVLDNLLKGAATQAMQNVNLALGWDENLGVAHE